MSELAVTIRSERPADDRDIERLHERAFGPGRFARTATRLREGAPAMPELSFVASVGTLLVGSVRVSPIFVGTQTALALGPLTVEPAFEKRGIGAALMDAALAAAAAAGHTLVLLIGDEPYYRRFGFVPAPAGQLRMPSPVDPARLLVRELVPGALEGAHGRVGALRS